MKEFSVTMKLHNNLLKERRQALRLTTKQAASECGMSYESYINLENLKISALKANGEWTRGALKVAAFFRTLPEDLFPRPILEVARPVIEAKIAASDMRLLSGSAVSAYAELAARGTEEPTEAREIVGRAMRRLTPIERDIVTRIHVHGETLDGVGSRYGVSRERIRQCLAGAERTMRYAARLPGRSVFATEAEVDEAIDREKLAKLARASQ